MSAANESTTIRWDQDDDGVVILTLDDPNQSANTMNAAYAASIRATVDRLEAEKDSITGVIITSAKKTFFAGGDLNDLKQATPDNADEIAGFVRDGKAVLRRLETLGKPVVAAINGAALGGGLEIALACHYRIVVDDPKAVVGFPEVQLGLLPGAGGVVRTVRMLGIVNALMGLLLQGQRLRPAKALEVGVVNEVVPTREDLIPAAKKWIAANPEAQQPWDADKKYKIPGGTPSTPVARGQPAGLPGQPAQADQGRQLPRAAPHHGRGGGGRAGRLRQRLGDRGPLLRGPGHRPGVQEHDPGVLLRPAAGHRRPRPARGDRDVHAHQGRGARRRHDGRRHRLRVRQGRPGGRAQGRRPGRRRSSGKGYSEKLVAKAVERGRSTQEDGRRAAGPDHRHHRPGRGRGRAAGDRGGVRGPQGQGRGLRRDRAASGARRAAGLQHLHPADHRAGRQRQPARRTSSGCTSSARWTRCRCWRSSGASRPPTRRCTARSTWPS